MAYSRLRRSSDQRKALLRDLVTDLILNGQIETTLTKAKELKRLADKMVTLGKANTLASRRQEASFIRFEKDEEGNITSKVQERRPDRVMTDGNEMIVVDFKFGRYKEEYDKQVREYMSLLQSMGYPQVKGYLWFVYKNEIKEVTL